MLSDAETRFVDALAKLTTGAADNCRIGLAVSGGPDSMALLLLAHRVIPNRICVATVDHGLRAEALGEAHFVAAICAERGISHRILTPALPITGNIQSSARRARYGLLAQWASALDCAYIATAHHADDQLETILMRLARGSGVDGLSGIRAAVSIGNNPIIRPLLGFTKSELVAICNAAGIQPACDPSNTNDAYDRVRMRGWLAAHTHPLDAVAASRSASALSEASAALDWTTQHFAVTRVHSNPPNYTLDPHDLPPELLRRLLLEILQRMEPQHAPRGDTVDRIIGTLIAGDKAMIGNVQCQGGVNWHFSPAPARRSTRKMP